MNKSRTIDAHGLPFVKLNREIKRAIAEGVTHISLLNVNGQRYIGDGLRGKLRITINGIPGNDLAAFMNGPEIVVYGNAQDCIANTMKKGRIIIHGNVGDLLGYAMRGGEVFVKGNVGYRAGIHMKACDKQIPVIVVGGTAADFFGEYMAGGIIILLGLNRQHNEPIAGDYTGTGMHGGIIYLRAEVPKEHLGKEVQIMKIEQQDKAILKKYIKKFAQEFGFDPDKILEAEFTKLLPMGKRPYGQKYAY